MIYKLWKLEKTRFEVQFCKNDFIKKKGFYK